MLGAAAVSPTVRQLVAHRALALEAVAGQEHLDRPVRWVHASELVDPAPFLEGGELLLTTGMRLTTSAPAARAYVQRLVGADVAALGFAVGLGHDTVPKALVTACSNAGLPLLLVPVQTPFIQISKTVSDLIAAVEREELARSLQVQRSLVRAAAASDGPGALLARLAKETRGWALLLDGHGRAVLASPAGAAARAADLAQEVERLRPKGLLAGSSLTAEGERIAVQPLGVDGRATGFLAVGAPEPWSTVVSGAVNTAVSLLSLEGARLRAADRAREGLDDVALALAVEGSVDRLPLDALGWTWAVDGALEVTVVRGGAQAREALLHRMRDAAADAGTAGACGRVGDEVVRVAPVRAAAGAADPVEQVLAATTQAVGTGVVAGRSTAAGLADVADAVRRAQQAVAAAVAGEGIVRFEDLAGGGLMALVDAEAADGFADAVLAPLLEAPAADDLLASLDAWLARHGQWDAAAQQLGVHRHTLRHRIRRIEAMLDRSLDDAGTRMELWFALRRRALRS